jgi:hypothetical protein
MCQSTGVNLRFLVDFDGDGAEDVRGSCRTSAVYTANGVSGIPGRIVVQGSIPPSTTLGPTNFKYTSTMTVFEPSDSGRPPENIATSTNVVTVVVPAPTTTLGRGVAATSDEGSGSAATVVALQSQLDVAKGAGQVVVNGSSAVFARPGRQGAVATGRRGENRVEAQLVEGAGPGSWRFELAGTPGYEPGSLRVVAGEVALVAGDAVVFRMAGRAGERVVFTFRTRN